ncbi:hypothetical protein [Flavobacterium hydatis]|uniref:Uncharacterized protein n=1 Tax=Flavobacterium hydatis TaxID=991 RepID=A0A086A080_FLAHY|nr:hypothetical protein [Flavobacterium hydatis]KFF10094.1 hypothetical protein IW20_21730 [Flavobacterium hydatis]OXA90355.1 hypothetical protein B0A62_20045 [Flavobacterium hydatis]
MKFKIKNILFPSFLVLCSFVKLQDQDIETGFSETCLKISSEYEMEDEHGNVFNNKTHKFLSLPEFSKILKTVSKYDLDKNTKYEFEESNIGKIEKKVWKNITKENKLISLKKLTFKTVIEQEFSGGKFKNEFEIIDYTITRNEKPKKIYLRIIENEFERITIDNVEYTGVFESRLLGIDEAEEEFDNLLNKK